MTAISSAVDFADSPSLSAEPDLDADARTNAAWHERFTRAEKLALEAPVKMLGPLVLCIFPCTFLVLGFPVVVRFFDA